MAFNLSGPESLRLGRDDASRWTRGGQWFGDERLRWRRAKKMLAGNICAHEKTLAAGHGTDERVALGLR